MHPASEQQPANCTQLGEWRTSVLSSLHFHHASLPLSISISYFGPRRTLHFLPRVSTHILWYLARQRDMLLIHSGSHRLLLIPPHYSTGTSLIVRAKQSRGRRLNCWLCDVANANGKDYNFCIQADNDYCFCCCFLSTFIHQNYIHCLDRFFLLLSAL